MGLGEVRDKLKRHADGDRQFVKFWPPCLHKGWQPWKLPAGRRWKPVLDKAAGRSGRLAEQLLRYDVIVIDELGYLPFSQTGGQLLFHLISKLYENTSLLITTKLAFADWPQVFGDANQNDHSYAGPPDPSLRHRGNWQ